MSTLELAGKRISRNAMFGLAAQVGYMVMRFIQTPWTLQLAGLEAYGFWSLLFVMLSYFGINRTGISTAYQTEVARNHVKGDWARSIRVLGSGTTVLLLLAIPAFGLAWLGADPILNLLKTSAPLREDARFAFLLTVGATWFSMVLCPFQSTLEGMQRHDAVRTVDFIANVFETVLIFAFLKWNQGLRGLALAYAARTLFSVAAFAFLSFRFAPQFKFRPCYPRMADIRELLSFGGLVQGMGCLFLVICSIDRFVLASISSLTGTGLYELARKLISFTATLPSQISGPMIPAAADLAARSENGNVMLGSLIQKTNRIIALILAPLLVFLSVLAQPILVGWLGHGEQLAAHMMWALSAGAYVHLLTGGITAALRGLGRTRSEMSYAVLWLVLGVALMPLFGWTWGPLGVALGSSLAQMGACALLLHLSARELDFDLKQWARNAFAPLAALLPVACILAMTWSRLKLTENRLNAAVFLGAAGVCFFGSTAVIYWNVFLHSSEQNSVKLIVGKFRPSTSAIATGA